MGREKQGAQRPCGGGRFATACARVMNNAAGASRTRVVCHTGVYNETLKTYHAGAHGRAREERLAAWRTKTFGGDFDPVRAAVDDAVAEFSFRQPEADRLIWLKVCNEIGYEAFLDLYFEQASIKRDAESRGRPLRNPAAAFHARLNRYTGHNATTVRRNFAPSSQEGGAK